jgi:hypothetical protein
MGVTDERLEAALDHIARTPEGEIIEFPNH